MPFAHVQIVEGRDEEQKAELIRQISDAIRNSIGAPRDTVRVVIQEVPETHWGVGGRSLRELRRQVESARE